MMFFSIATIAIVPGGGGGEDSPEGEHKCFLYPLCGLGNASGCELLRYKAQPHWRHSRPPVKPHEPLLNVFSKGTPRYLL